jgi:hypothetical protein
MSTRCGCSELIEVFTIFKKYIPEEGWPTNCSHDVLAVLCDPADVSEEDKARLDELGFIPASEWEGFISFRYGSA